MTRHYATCARVREIPVLLASMRRHCGDFRLWVLAWDYNPGPWALDDDVEVVERADFLHQHDDLEPSRLPGPPRSAVDTVATVRWQFFADVMEATDEPLTWLDGDLWFFSSPEPLYAELAAARARLAVSPHRIPSRAAGRPGVCVETHGQYGRFNTGFGWAADPAPLREMAALNREWSYTEVVPRHRRRPLFGDQAHMEDVADRHGAHVIQHPGVNAAPWNAHNLPITRGMYADHPFIGGDPLVCWHFSSMRPGQLANACYEVERAPGAVDLIYRPYVEACAAAAREAAGV